MQYFLHVLMIVDTVLKVNIKRQNWDDGIRDLRYQSRADKLCAIRLMY
jgi:hypothetical protein